MIRAAVLTGLLACLAAAGCAPTLPDYEPAKKAVWLDQNWNDHERHWFHHANQGTSTLPVPFAWFMVLERPELYLFEKPKKLSDIDYLTRFGFIPSPVGVEGDADSGEYGFGTAGYGRKHGSEGTYDRTYYEGNPKALPVGFVRNGEAIGLTCAACHTGHLEHEGVSLRIDGAPALIDLGKLRTAIGLSLVYTKYVPGRFSRFADSLLGPNHSEARKAQLSSALDALLAKLKAVTDLQKPASKMSVEEGFARLDALNRIGNQVFFVDLLGAQGFDASVNIAPTDAPVNFPHIWDAPWFLWVQYDASIMQPMVRNAGEALGVLAQVNMKAPNDPMAPLYASQVRVREIHDMEQMIAGDNPFSGKLGFKGLRAPEWPATYLGALDNARVDRGRELYREHCAGCHLPPVKDPGWGDPDAFWKVKQWLPPNKADERYLVLKEIDIDYLGTDAAQARVLIDRRIELPKYLDVRDFEDRGRLGACYDEDGKPTTDASFGVALAAVVEKTVNYWYDANDIPPEQREAMNGNRPNCIQAKPVYKARPLDGIWATAPYLHNGSVPTLWDLLGPANERPETFCLGSRQFDTEKVGYSTECISGSFKLDTKIAGNHNRGHEFRSGPNGKGVIGPAFTDEQRRDLVEYLKSL